MMSRLVSRTEAVLAEVAGDRNHPIRVQLSAGLIGLAERLENDPDLRRRGEELKAELLAQPTVRNLAAAVWADIKLELKEQSADPGSELRRRLADGIAHTGRRLTTDLALAEAAQRSLDAVIRAALTSFDTELIGLVTGTVARWDARDTARRLELLLGPDLQYIRINGTVFGALAGLALHAISVAA
jgi:uncharacterized membrane-anchored protein YjiN (DUF445 family)